MNTFAILLLLLPLAGGGISHNHTKPVAQTVTATANSDIPAKVEQAKRSGGGQTNLRGAYEKGP